MQIDINDKAALRQLVNTLTERSQKEILVPLLKSQLHLLDGEYHKAKSSLKEIFYDFEADQNTIFLVASIISKIKNEAGLKVILLGIRKELLGFWLKTENVSNLKRFLKELRFNKTSEPLYLKTVSKFLISFFANTAYQQKQIDLAFFLEQEIYTNYITAVETEKAFGYGMKLTLAEAEKAGRSQSLAVNDFQYDNEVTKIGFFFHNASMLAHISNIFSYLKMASEKSFSDFIPHIFCLGGRHERFEQSFAEIGVQVVYLDVDEQQNSIPLISERLHFLKKQCAALKIDKIVWGCLASFMPYAFSMRIAKEQIWWSQKWQSLDSRHIDKYIWSYSMDKEKTLYARTWRCGWFQQNTWLTPNSNEMAEDYRAHFPGKVILGSLARTDKLRDVVYLNIICEILKKHKNTVYLWAGREEDTFIKSKFEAAGVYSRTKFIGWVDTNKFAHVFDILMDTISIGNGSTALQAMQAGTPVLIYKSSPENKTLDQLTGSFLTNTSKENQYARKTGSIFTQSNFGDLYTCASNAEEYLSIADKLIVDVDFRAAVGNAFAKFVKELMTTPETSYDIFTEHLLA